MRSQRCILYGGWFDTWFSCRKGSSQKMKPLQGCRLASSASAPSILYHAYARKKIIKSVAAQLLQYINIIVGSGILRKKPRACGILCGIPVS